LCASVNNRFQIVINFSTWFDKSYLQDSGYSWNNLPIGLKGFAMTELRITKNVSTSTSWEIANIKASDSLEAGSIIHLGTEDTTGFNFRAYLGSKGNPATSKYFSMLSTGTSITISTQNRTESSAGEILLQDIGSIQFTPPNGKDLGAYKWSLSSKLTDEMIRWRGPNSYSSPSVIVDYITLLVSDYTAIVNAAHGAVFINVQKADLDFVVSGEHTETYLFNVDASAERVGIKTETPAYVLDVTGGIRSTANITAYSDIRVKENIRPIEDALFKVTQLEGVTFDRKDEDEMADLKGKQMGLIAQQVEPIVPEVVEIDNEGMYSLSYGNLAGLFVESIKELKQEVDDLKKEIQELKNGSSK